MREDGMKDSIAPVLSHWQYDDEIEGDAQDWMPDMTMTFQDGSQHFCLIATPQTLAHRVGSSEAYYWNRHLVVVRSYSADIVDQALRRLDALGHLTEAAFPMLGRYEEVL